MADKLFTPQEAALAVLAKAAEIAHTKLEKGEWNKIHSKLEHEGYPKESADKIDGAIKAKVQGLKKDEMGGEGDMAGQSDMAMSETPPANGTAEPKMKGHIKLAKFIGRMDHKRGKPAQEMDKSQVDQSLHDRKMGNAIKGVHKPEEGGPGPGRSDAGLRAEAGLNASSKKQHKEVLGEIKAQPKPNLP